MAEPVPVPDVEPEPEPETIKIIIISVAGITIVILLYLIIRFLYSGITKDNIKSVYTNNANLTNFQNHIYKIFYSTFNNDSNYFNAHNVLDNYKDYANVNLYNNPFDNRSFATDSIGTIYKNLSNTFTK